MNGVKCSLIIYLLRVFMKGGYKMISLMKITWKFDRKGIQSIIFSNAECFKSGEINFAFT